MGGFQMPAMAHPPLMNQPPQIFGAHAYDGLPMQHLPPELTAQMFGDPNGLLDDANEAKRRRIARVSTAFVPATAPRLVTGHAHQADSSPTGLRHVPEEEDQVRREAASMYTLHQLQDRMCLYPGREEAQSAQRVSTCPAAPGSLCRHRQRHRQLTALQCQVYRGPREPAWSHGESAASVRYALFSLLLPNGLTAASGCSGCCRQARHVQSRTDHPGQVSLVRTMALRIWEHSKRSLPRRDKSQDRLRRQLHLTQPRHRRQPRCRTLAHRPPGARSPHLSPLRMMRSANRSMPASSSSRNSRSSSKNKARKRRLRLCLR